MPRIKDKVTIPGIGSGWIGRIRYDDSGEPMYDILLEDSLATPDGWYMARNVEMVPYVA